MTDKSHLLRFGYAPGHYWFVCSDCEQKFYGDKYARRCETCAGTLYSQVSSVEAVADKHRTAPMTIPEQAVQAMPERIFLGCADTDNEHQVWTDEGEGGTEYVRADLAAPHLAAVPADPWVDTRLVRFDDTIVFGRGGFDFDRWEGLRWEMHTRHGSFAVWKSDSKTWSMYGGKYGFLMLDRFSSEEEAKAEAEQIVVSLDAEPSAGRAAVLEEALRIAKSELEAWMRCARKARIGVTSTPHVIDHIDMVLASHPVADKPDEAGAQGEVIERIEFQRGYVLACANIVNLHGPDVNVAEGFAQLNISRDDLKRLDLCDYDQNAIHALEDFWGLEKLYAPSAPASEGAE
ncbi:hypothetical protein [Brucella sp. NBRC 113783]|uniref:hypothetical protein n=1 Tax=Brucella sp. NBRC 113783 TaxID=3075478 RepID=UPI0029C00699|nr:hypothetical protein [Brucella sp. NBRC 113783]MDX4072546.1 hypothetical protein [Brucella sp. NBRC 113783]